MLPWIRATAASVVRPRPSATSNRGAWLAGRNRLATPSRHATGRRTRARRAPAINSEPPTRNTTSVAAALPQNDSAKMRFGAVPTTMPTSASTSAALAIHTGAGTPRPAGSSASRNSAAPGICAARASGHSANAPAVSTPYSAAKASGPG